jgi:choline-sulfatase
MPRTRTPERPRQDRGASRTARTAWVLAAVALVAVAGWTLRPRPGVRRESGLSVLLISVDTLRADALGCYGNARALTPSMDRLAAGGVRFADAHAHNVVTLPSHANILSGRYPMDHGVRDNSGFRFPSRVETLATLLKAQGYATAAFVSAFPLDARFGLARGFDVYDDSFVDAGARPAFLVQERPGPVSVALARRWIEAQHERPFFCWLHVYEPHFPYQAPEPFASRFAGEPYQAEVAASDAAMAPLLEPILGAAERGRTLVVLTSDHGESLGEHGEATHGIFAYEATLRVPLVVYQPRLFPPRVVAAPARHVDILPTILDALGLAAPDGIPGRSLLPVMAGAAGDSRTSYFEALSGAFGRGWAPLYGVLRDQTKYVELPVPELYDLAADPAEAQNLARPDAPRQADLRTLLATLRAPDAAPPPVPEDADTRERLQSLGYVAGGPAILRRSFGVDDDPKRLMALDALLQEVVGLYGAGDLENALARCRELVGRRPTMAIGLLHLAHLERESGNLPAAIDALRQALRLNPDDRTTLALLGTYLTQGGRAAEAVELLAPAASRAPADVDVLVARGVALAKLGRHAEAIASIEQARVAAPHNAMLLVDLGTVHLMARARDKARAAFEQALARNPGVARAHSSLGMMAGEDGDFEQAALHFKAAVAIDPRECEKIPALSALLWQQGRKADARRALELFVATAPEGRYARAIESARSRLASLR